MLVQIAYVLLSDGREAVVRSTPEEVLKSVEHAKGKILFQVQGEVHSAEEEFALLWSTFVVEAKKYGRSDTAEQKAGLFFRKGKNLWTTFDGIPNVALFTNWTDDMFVQVSKNAAH